MAQTNEDRLCGLMGLCVRARQAVFGEDGCLKTIRNGSCGLLLMDAGASKATAAKYEGACRHAGVPLRVLPEDLLEQATGRPGMAMAVQKGGLAEQLLKLLPRTENETKEENATGSGAAGNKCGGGTIECQN